MVTLFYPRFFQVLQLATGSKNPLEISFELIEKTFCDLKLSNLFYE